MDFNFEMFNKPATAWQRFWARSIDTCLINAVIILGHYQLMEILKINRAAIFQWLLLPLIMMFIDVFYEAYSLSHFGTTLGKRAFGIKILTVEGTYLSFSQSMTRTAKVWLMGHALNIPMLSLIARIAQYSELQGKGSTSWDATQAYSVVIEPNKRAVFAPIIVIGTIILYLVIYSYGIGSSSEVFHPSVSAMETKVDDLMYENDYQGIIDYLETQVDEGHTSDVLMNQLGYAYMSIDAFEEGKESFLKGLEIYETSDTLDTLYNNLSWACYMLGEYEDALHFSNLGLDLGENDAMEYLNYGNVLGAIDRTDEAIEAYENSLKEDENTKEAYYGLGTLKYEAGDYKAAIGYFDKYIAIKEDADAYCYLALSHMYFDDSTTKAEMYLNKANALEPESQEVIDSWGIYYRYVGDYPAAISLYEKQLELDPENYTLLCDLGEAYSYNYQDDLAIETLDRAITLQPKDTYAYALKAKIYFWQEDEQKVEQSIMAMFDKCEANFDTYYAAGEIYYNTQDYLEAAKYYELAIELDGESELAYEGEVAALYYAKRYTRCIEIANRALAKFDNLNINWYLGFVYSDLNDSEQAIDYYMNALAILPDDVNLLTNIGWEYFYKQDFEEANIWVDKALSQDNLAENANDLRDALLDKQRPLMTQISEFVETNYLYFKSNETYKNLKADLLEKEIPEVGDVYDLVGTVYNPEDMFTFILSGQDYADYEEMIDEKTIEYKEIDHETDYIHITAFMPNTSNEFLDAIEAIENPEEETLIIDLRDNYGGDVRSSCNILDYLLGDCVVCNLIDKSGYSTEYYSDEDQILFKKIYVLTNEYTASSSELLTLGLKTYLDNVTVIGQTTYGKGVGQTLYEDKTSGFVLFLVNFYWNVREINIMDVGIEPDIQVDSDKLEDYLDAIEEL